jgi:acetyltransferase-like isoleucine patch superfamily enzyme
MWILRLIRAVRYIIQPGFDAIGRARERYEYYGVGMARHVNLDIQGEFAYGHECGINEGSNIIISHNARLHLGDGCYIGRYVELQPGGLIEIGSETSIQDRCILLGDVIIGRHCLFAPNVYISSGRHYFDLEPSWLIKDQDRLVFGDKELASAHSRPVIVEDDCWLGINVVVMAGVKIGKGAVVGASSVVLKDVAPYSVVAGAPAKVIRKRLDFVPPASISYDNPNDFPYFYAGFEISKAALEKHAAYKGILARDAFIICLNASAGNSLHLIARNVSPNRLTLAFGDQFREISNQFEEVVFEVGKHAKETSRFHMQANKGADKLIIQKAWVQ